MAYRKRTNLRKFERQSLTRRSTTTFTLNYSPASQLNISKCCSVIQDAVAYNVINCGTQIQFTGRSSDNVYVVFLGVQTDVAVVDSSSIKQTELAESTPIYF